MDAPPPRPRRAVVARVLLVPYLFALALVVWLPGEDAEKATGIVETAARLLAAWGLPFEIGYPVLEFLANVVLFVPFGALVMLSFPALRWWQVILLGCATSTTIELVQILLPGRFPTVSDVVANTLGTAAGRVAAAVVRRPRSARASVEA